ncbi:MAG: CopG/Arc/MetJ DNA-binding domain-containing transcriptional regulator [Parcubacteria group bacterium GW2011_GWA2_49_9]|nr:MAG: CopG/Arc/MetJ DNA-binding domain-containing transcriptional regulator [Parcubacteria group bacterium GW2011_GWA2_49_9]
MRNILNISLPKEMVVDIKRGVKAGKFASTSEFMRHLIRVWNTQKLAEELKAEREQFRKGNYKVLKSLKDLR